MNKHTPESAWTTLSAVLGTAVLSILPALAATTGSLQVKVTGPDGKALPGATVVIESPAQPGQRSLVSGGAGEARFNAILPGVYKVTVSFPGYNTEVREDNQVRLDSLTDVAIRLEVGMVETVKVKAERPLIDVTSSSTGQDLSLDYIETLPLLSTGTAWTHAELVAGVRRSGNAPSVHGATPTDNLYLVDGVNDTSSSMGIWGSLPNPAIMDQMEVTTAGHRAEYGSVVGMTTNLVTKSGGNVWSGSLDFYMQDDDWQADDKHAEATRKANSQRYGYTLGGPIIRDRLWHFSSWFESRDEIDFFVEDSTETRLRTLDASQYFFKLTWQVTPGHRLIGHLSGDPVTTTGFNAYDFSIAPDQFMKHEQGGDPNHYSLRYTGVLGPRLVLEAQASARSWGWAFLPQYPEAGPNFSAPREARMFGGYWWEVYDSQDRDEIRVDLSWFKPTSWGQHNLKVGTSYSESNWVNFGMPSGGENFDNLPEWGTGATLFDFFGPSSYLLFQWQGLERYNPGVTTFVGGTPSLMVSDPGAFTDPADWTLNVGGTTYTVGDYAFNTPSEHADAAALGWVRFRKNLGKGAGAMSPVGNDLLAIYAQDDWRIGRWNLSLGLRLERQAARDSEGNTIFDFDDTIAPRLGVTWDVKGDGRQKVYARYGRLYDPLRDETAGWIGQFRSPLRQRAYYFEPVDQYLVFDQWGGEVAPQVVAAPVLETPYTDEYLLGWAIDLGANRSLEITGIKRRTRDITEDLDPVFGLLGLPEQLGVTDDAGNTLTDQEFIDNTLRDLGFTDVDGSGMVDAGDIDARWVAYNPPGAKRDFTGADVTFRKRFANNWTMLGSYSYGDFEGNVPWDDSFSGSYGDNPYYDPRLGHNYGSLEWSTHHMFKVSGSYSFPFGLTFGGLLRANSGGHYGLRIVPNVGLEGVAYWDGDPARIVDSLTIDRDEFSAELGIPADDEALDAAIISLIPLDLRAGRGAYEDPWSYDLNLSLRYQFGMWKKLYGQTYFAVWNVFDWQGDTNMISDLWVTEPVNVANISDRDIYEFGTPYSYHSPRRYQVGLRFAF